MQREEDLRRELLAEVKSIAPVVAEQAAASESLGRLSEPTMAALRKTRLLRYWCPLELGGLEADPVTHVIVLEALTRVDAAAGWTLGILAGASGLAGAYLPAPTTRRLFANGVPPVAGTTMLGGVAEPAPGGYRVRGRWQYASGIYHADWVAAATMIPGMSLPAGGRLVLLPRDQVVVHDNWQVAGLRGSGSSDYSVEDQFVPEEMTFSLIDFLTGNAVTGVPRSNSVGRPSSLHFTSG
jgi:alkylation response protein AidB-like acyl-CoA dehydrogenase